MPSNSVRINDGWRIYEVGDSVMPKLLELLDQKSLLVDESSQPEEVSHETGATP